MSVLVTLADGKAHLNVTATTDDTKIQLYLDAAEEIVEEIGDIIINRAVTDWLDGGRTTAQLTRVPVASVTSVTEYDGVTANTLTSAATPADATGTYHYQLDAATGLLLRLAAGRPVCFRPGRRTVRAVYTAGQASSAPDRALLAIRELLAYWWRHGQRGTSTAMYNEAEGVVTTTSAGGEYLVPTAVRQLLQPLPGIA